MREIIKVKALNIFPLISELLENGQTTKITVSGNSMYPFLRNSIDSVELTKGSFKRLSRGDIVIIQRSDGSYIMHRIYNRKTDYFFVVGDAQQRLEGPLYQTQLVAVVTAIWRKDKRISCSSNRLRLLSAFWLYLHPLGIKSQIIRCMMALKLN